jgi:di/tricarboxylate transporter
VPAAFGWLPLLTTSFLGALAMITTGCLPGREARRSVDLTVLIIIAAALGLGKAIEITGLADACARLIVQSSALLGTIGALAAIYLVTSILTELITNNAAAALTIAIAMATAKSLAVPVEAFAIAVAIAASASFMTPIGYQTNLMVLAAGGYRFSDYLRSGLLVNLIVAVITISLIKIIWL